MAGTQLLNSGGQSRSSIRLILHANYNSNNLNNDIAVIRLSTALSIDDTTQQTALNTMDVGAVAAILAGWGRTSTTAPIPNNLQQLITQTIPTAACQSNWGTTLVTPQHICIFMRVGQGASCQGNAGGPLFLTSNRAQIGILSFGQGCGLGLPDVLTRVSSYINWISSAVAS